MSLYQIQSRLKAPKRQFNDFAKYHYRSQEDILEALKPLLAEYEYTLNISDEIELIGSRYYVKATVTIWDKDRNVVAQSTAYAREPESKKGSDESQITGAASSYARKYSLNGLLAIDDNKDADATNTHGKDQPKDQKKAAPKPDAKKAPPPDNAATKEQQDRLVHLGADAMDMSPTEVRDFAAYYRKGDRLTKDEAQDLIDNFEDRLAAYLTAKKPEDE